MSIYSFLRGGIYDSAAGHALFAERFRAACCRTIDQPRVPRTGAIGTVARHDVSYNVGAQDAQNSFSPPHSATGFEERVSHHLWTAPTSEPADALRQLTGVTWMRARRKGRFDPMLKRLLSTVLVLSAVLFFAACAFAEHFAHFNEFYNEKVVCQRAGGARTCDVVGSGRYHVFMKLDVDLLTVNPDEIDGETSFYLLVADHPFVVTPSDDPKWKAGKKSFKVTVDDAVVFGDGAVVSVKWNARFIRASVTGRTTGPDVVVFANLGNSGPISDSTYLCIVIDTAVPVDLCAQNRGSQFYYTGKAHTKTVTKGGESFDISKISVKGKGTMVQGP
jgi:hypothetical protein